MIPQWVQLLLADVHRITGRASAASALRQFVVGETYRYNVAMRFSASRRSVIGRLVGRIVLRRQRVRLGINIPAQTQVGPGFLIGHMGGIVVNAAAVIGANCNISHNVTIGVTRGEGGGVPRLGDRVYVGPGAVIIGNISVGNDVAIGANAVVTSDIPEGMTAVGNPARVIPGGSANYINRISRMTAAAPVQRK